ncbi:Stk1 family PASTA domain-containing Ser/Thr kinase [Egicoccus sp. AB-alg6-2]|uniref:Stk1 family PASTA domain-containing Ser/Thr kinase n=1 Tax=Egicoccus sp. AB-alg6-2 TaxID=3242692 RepID=UPI00359DF4E9
MPNSPASRDATPTRVGGRYALRGEIGRGGMATVHRAVDEVLEREVAVKLLHAHLATDPAFLDRFRREARAAAALAHPNVVAVHDWGETDEGAYLVLQLIEGPSLRAVLRRHGRLTPPQALGVLAPAAAGLGSAHRAGLVHRDVKPENLLLGADGQVHVTDFGLARAAASATSTFGADVLVGSPHYLSPEAVRGQPLDPRADVYALGVTLFECLTGRPPHEGESPFATAVAHTSRRVPPPSSLVDDIPAELDELVLAATSHDPDERPEDGSVFARELSLAVPAGIAPLDLHDLAGDTVLTARPQPSGGTMTFEPADHTTLVGRGGPPPPPGATAVEEDLAGETLDDDVVERRRGRGWLVALLVLGLLAASAAAGYLVWDRVLAPVTSIPSVVEAPQDDAVAELETAGFVVALADERPHDLDVPAGHVLAQEPLGTARRGARVLLTLSAGPRQVTVPDVVGDAGDVAAQRLRDAGLTPTVIERHDDDVAEGLVISTEPGAAEVVDESSPVDVVVSLGPQPIDIPDVVGRTEADAEATLVGAGLRMRVVDRPYDGAAAGTVIRQNPNAQSGPVLPGETIDVAVSRGPQPVEVPQVRNMLVEEAVATLQELGLEVAVERRGGFGAFLRPNRVFEQDPGPGATLLPGQTVTVYAYEE